MARRLMARNAPPSKVWLLFLYYFSLIYDPNMLGWIVTTAQLIHSYDRKLKEGPLHHDMVLLGPVMSPKPPD